MNHKAGSLGVLSDILSVALGNIYKESLVPLKPREQCSHEMATRLGRSVSDVSKVIGAIWLRRGETGAGAQRCHCYRNLYAGVSLQLIVSPITVIAKHVFLQCPK